MFLNGRIAKPKYLATLVDRPRLYRQLDRWQEQRAIVIHAPTGYGKSSLVSRWLDLSGQASSAAWLALAEDDNGAHEFSHHLAAALDRVVPGALALIQPILEDSQGTAERVLERLFSTYWDEAGAAALPSDRHMLLVLDDLHRVQSAAVDAVIRTILEQGPPNLHLMLLARRQTTLPLARLFAHGEILALNADDLRFTAEEVNDYLLRQGFPPPTEAEVAQLTARSEGWVTALHLAVLASHGQGSVADMIQALHGESMWLAKYLTDEVLDQQRPELRRFLLYTSILDEFSASLCAAVTGDGDANTWLDEIARGDLFLIPLDERTRWFRYHHLFQEMLQQRLQAGSSPDLIAELHRRAASWLVGAGDFETAVQHFLAAGDSAEAADLVERQIHTMLVRAPYRARDLLALLPHELLVQRPQLMLDRCRLAMLFDDERTLLYAQEAGRTLQAQQPMDKDAGRHHAEWLVLQEGGSFIKGDLAAAASFAEQARPLVSYLDELHSGLFYFLQVHLYNYSGRSLEAERSAEIALAAFARAEFAAGAVALRRELAKWSMRKGNAREAGVRFQELFDNTDPGSLSLLRDLLPAYFAAAENSYWQNHRAQAQTYQRSALDMAIQLQDAQLIHAAHYLGELLDAKTGETDKDLAVFAEHLAQATIPRVYELLVDYKTQRLLSVGRSDQAWQVVQSVRPDLKGGPVNRVSRGVIAYLRAAISVSADPATVTQALAEALAFASRNGNRLDQLQLVALLAWQQQRQNDDRSAETLLEAVRLASETGYVRVLLGIPDLSARLQKMGVSLAAASAPGEGAAAVSMGAGQLTNQELRVLELLAADYTYDQIAAELVISANTVRTHVRHLYAKLSANRRDQAIRQAVRRGLLPPRTN
jgi:LuxR family maltose regulon positive regulatory protein